MKISTNDTSGVYLQFNLNSEMRGVHRFVITSREIASNEWNMESKSDETHTTLKHDTAHFEDLTLYHLDY